MTGDKRTGKTASELLRELAQNEEYQSRMREQELERRNFDELLSKDEAELVQELNQSGHDVESVWDFVNTSQPYPNAIPILIDHLSKNHHPRIREGIVRALTVKEARGVATNALIKEYKESTDESEGGYKWVVANALTVTFNESSTENIAGLAINSKHTSSRILLGGILDKLNNEAAQNALEKLSIDDDPKVAARAKDYLNR